MKKITLLFVLLLCLFSSNTNAQWVQCEGIYGGNITCLASSGNNIFAGTGDFEWYSIIWGGVYFSSNNGTNWVQTTLYCKNIFSLTALGNNVFAGTDSGVFMTENGGDVWIYVGGASSQKVQYIQKTKELFALGTYEGHIFINLKGREPKGIVEEVTGSHPGLAPARRGWGPNLFRWW